MPLRTFTNESILQRLLYYRIKKLRVAPFVSEGFEVVAIFALGRIVLVVVVGFGVIYFTEGEGGVGAFDLGFDLPLKSLSRLSIFTYPVGFYIFFTDLMAFPSNGFCDLDLFLKALNHFTSG
jgi:hypothetical protein